MSFLGFLICDLAGLSYLGCLNVFIETLIVPWHEIIDVFQLEIVFPA